MPAGKHVLWLCLVTIEGIYSYIKPLEWMLGSATTLQFAMIATSSKQRGFIGIAENLLRKASELISWMVVLLFMTSKSFLEDSIKRHFWNFAQIACSIWQDQSLILMYETEAVQSFPYLTDLEQKARRCVFRERQYKVLRGHQISGRAMARKDLKQEMSLDGGTIVI